MPALFHHTSQKEYCMTLSIK
uniref:Uncharacterized protein n=1 Tax=Rhizophora mucronata TaxID=61149 RepID=A0A2P2NVH1_RHIMU